MIKRCAQELLGYHFTVVHRMQRMMKDVDSLNRFLWEPSSNLYHNCKDILG